MDCGYGYKLVCCYDDKYSKPVETYRGEGAVNKFTKRMLDEVKCCVSATTIYTSRPTFYCWLMYSRASGSFQLLHQSRAAVGHYSQDE